MAHPTGESPSEWIFRLDFNFVGPWSRPTRDCWHTVNSTMHWA